jgi:predicted metal-dependent peptidase
VTVRIFTPKEKVQNARLELVTNFVFYGSVFFRVNVFEDPDCKTAWTDGLNIGYNLDYTASLEHEEIIGLFVHEVKHIILKHPLREALNPDFKKNHGKFNRACDYALNAGIETTRGMKVNPNWLLDMTRWPDNLAEEIFYQLQDDPADDRCKDGGKAGDPGRGGETQPGEVRPYKEGKASKAEIDQASNEIDQWVQAAGMKATGHGSLTAGEKALIKQIVAPSVHWTDELQHLVDEITKDDYTWTRPNNRYIQQGVYLPTMWDQNMSDLVIFVDTSGSLSDRQLAQIMAEIRKIVQAYNVRVIVIYWDTRFKHMELFEPIDVLASDWALNARGRGGTDFSRCWAKLEDLEDINGDPKGIIFFSDFETTDWPMGFEPDCPVVWCQVPDEEGRFNDNYVHHMPDYGSRVRVPINREGGPC